MPKIDHNAITFHSRVHPIVHWLGILYIKITGWTVIGGKPAEKKYILIAAPHTSNWDAAVLFATAAYLNLRLLVITKEALFRWPLGVIMRFFGGVPIDRSAAHGVVGQMIENFNRNEDFVLTITPEGTRQKGPHWKMGFYHIAMGAKVPIALAYVDYERKITGIGPPFMLSGDVQKDFDHIREYYAPFAARYPDQFCEPSFPPAKK